MTAIVIAHATTGSYGHKNALQRTAANRTPLRLKQKSAFKQAVVTG
jgi:hypothetical protein